MALVRLALVSTPYLFNLSTTHLKPDFGSKEFQYQLHSTLQVLTPVKKILKKTSKTLDRQTVLTQIISGDAEAVTD